MCDYKNLDRNQLEDEYGWLIIDQTDWDRLVNLVKIEIKKTTLGDILEDKWYKGYMQGQETAYNKMLYWLDMHLFKEEPCSSVQKEDSKG